MEAVAFKLSCWRGAVLLPSAARLSQGKKKKIKKNHLYPCADDRRNERGSHCAFIFSLEVNLCSQCIVVVV